MDLNPEPQEGAESHGRAEPPRQEAKPAEIAKAPPKITSQAREAEVERREGDVRKQRRPLVIAIAIVLGLVLIAGAVYYYVSGLGSVSTDDAFTDGNAVTVAPQVAGRVSSLDVSDNELVRAGQPIIHIDDRQFVMAVNSAKAALDSAKAQAKSAQIAVGLAKIDYPATLQQAQGQLATAQANLVNTQRNYERQSRLTSLATSQQQIDAARAAYAQAQGQVSQAQAQVAQAKAISQHVATAQAQYEQTQAQVEQAQAQLDQAKLSLSYAIVKAPQDGWITNRAVNKGDYVAAGQQIVALVSPKIWVTANFKETELDRMRPGDPVDIYVDAYPKLKLKGRVASFQHGTGSKFSAFPAENATGNFVKIVQRVPVKIDITSGLDPKEAMPLGLSVEPTVHLK